MAQKSRADLLAWVNSQFPDNNTQFITPQRARNVMVDFIDSNLNLIDDPITVNIGTGAKTLWVSKAGNDTTGQKGLFNKPYATIQKAVTESVSGDVIFVLAGEYTENISGVKQGCKVIFENIILNGNIENTSGSTNVVLEFINSVVNGVPNANNNTLTGKILLKNSTINIGSGTLSGNVGLNLFGDGYSTITASGNEISGGKIGGSNGNVNVEGVRISGGGILFFSGLFKNCKITDTTIQLPEFATGDLLNCQIENANNVFTFFNNNCNIRNIENCIITGNKLYDNGRALTIGNIKKSSFILTNPTSSGVGSIKMIGSDCNLSKDQFRGSSVLTDYYSQFNY